MIFGRVLAISVIYSLKSYCRNEKVRMNKGYSRKMWCGVRSVYELQWQDSVSRLPIRCRNLAKQLCLWIKSEFSTKGFSLYLSKWWYLHKVILMVTTQVWNMSFIFVFDFEVVYSALVFSMNYLSKQRLVWIKKFSISYFFYNFEVLKNNLSVSQLTFILIRTF